MDSENDFASVLRRSGLSENLARRIADEGFNEASFEKVDAPLLKVLGFLGAEILAILSIKDKGLAPTVESEDTSYLANRTDGERTPDGSTVEPDPSQDMDKMLGPYFDPKELKEMNNYSKKPYFEQLKRWKDTINTNPKMADIMKPSFVTSFEAKEKMKAIREENKLKRKAMSRESQESSPKQLCLRPRRTPASPAQPSTSRITSSSSSVLRPIILNASQGPSTISSPSSLRPLNSNASQGPPPSCSSSSSTPPILSASQATSTSSSSALDTLLNKNRAEAQLNQPSSKLPISWVLDDIIPKFDVQSVLCTIFDKDRRGKAILKQLQENESPLNSADRKLVVRHLTHWLYKIHVSDPRQVTSDLKEELAKSIAVNYSKTFWIANENNVAPWASLFDRDGNTGFIVNAARPIQKQHQQRKSSNKKGADDDQNDSGETDDGIDRLALIVPSSRVETKQEIMRGMGKYFALRTQERNQGKTITYFLTKYIHFTSYGGEVILEEFAKMHPRGEENDMPAKFLEVMPKILALPAKRDIELNLNDNVLLSLTLLSQYLPHDIPRKADRKAEQTWAVEEDLVVVLQTKDNVDDHIIDKRTEANGPVQPYLILIRSDLDQKIVRYFLVLESKAVELSCVNLSSPHATLQAFDVLMKSYVVFNVHHPYGWRNTLHFVQHYLLGVEEVFTTKRGRRSKSSPSQATLWAQLTD